MPISLSTFILNLPDNDIGNEGMAKIGEGIKTLPESLSFFELCL